MKCLLIVVILFVLILPASTTAQEPDPIKPVTQNADWTPIVQEFDGVKMVLVPPGCFMMGSEEGNDNEAPVHEQCLDEPFWLDQYEVTNEQYGSVGCISYSSEPDEPRNCVTWVEAYDYCESRGVHLPTEREWEYAARGPDGLIYPWGNDWNEDNVVWGGNSGRHTATVGSKPDGVSWVGAYDLSGNVWEWVSTIYEAYPYDAEDGREDMDVADVSHVLRGGSWLGDTKSLLRGSHRNRDKPEISWYYNGFRCARDFYEDDLLQSSNDS